MIPNKTLAVTATDESNRAPAEGLANELGVTFIPYPEQIAASLPDYLLIFTPDFLGLEKTANKKHKPFYIDFLSGKMQYRSQQAGLRNELIARAMGVKPSDKATIIDATAGLGRDGFILAKLGFQVTLLERSPVLHALLSDALKRLQYHPASAEIANRLHLIKTDAKDWINNNQNPDIIYLDPMFPLRQKSASVKKEMVILQDLLGNDNDATSLLELALTCAHRRVVVKRPRLAENLSAIAPSFTLLGKSCRFDVYLTSK